MSDIRHTHPGYFQVITGLAIPWYMGLGVGFYIGGSTLVASNSKAYHLIDAYIPLRAWAVIYFALGLALLISASAPSVPHGYVRVCCGIGLTLTIFWLSVWIVALLLGRMDLIAVIPAFTAILFVEFAALREPQMGGGR